MDLLRLLGVSVVGIANIGLAMTVFLRNRKSAANRAFAAAVTMIVCWFVLAYFSDQPDFREWAVLLNRLTLSSSILMGALLLYFGLVFPTQHGALAKWWYALFGVGVGFAVMTSATPLIVAGVRFAPWGTDVVAGPLFPMLAVWTIGTITLLVAVVTQKFSRSHGRERAQIKYVFLGLLLFSLTALSVGLVLPMITGSYRWSSLNTFTSLFLVGFTAYATIKHRFMDIRLMALRAVAYSVMVAGLGATLVAVAAITRASLTSRLGINPDFLFVGTCLGAVFAFQPIRKSVTHATDRVFYQRTYDPQRLLGRLGAAMASTLDLNDLGRVLVNGLSAEMRLTFAAVAYSQGGRPEVVTTGQEFSEAELQRLLERCDAGKVVFADDPDTDLITSVALAESGTRALVPLMGDGVVLGAILLGARMSGELFSAQDASFLRILGAEAAISVKNALLFDEKNQRVRELSALNTLAWALGRDMQFDAVLERALHQVMQVTSAEAGSIMLVDETGEALTIAVAKGLPEDVVEETRVQMGEGIAGWVAQNRRALVLGEVTDSGFELELQREGIKSALSVPLVRKGQVTGVLNVSKMESSEAFSRENLKVVAAFAGQLAIALENAKLYVDLENTFLGTIGALAAAVDAKDSYTSGHSSDVTEYSLAIAEELGLREAEREMLRIGALLHDIGKIGVEGSILNKPGRLTEDEYEIIKSHPDIAANILGSLDFLQGIVPLVLHHHEQYSGGGYPAGIAGESIPLGARIIAVADAFNAMTSDRPYRKALTYEAAARELRVHSGTQFDPDVVDAFLRLPPRLHPAKPGIAGIRGARLSLIVSNGLAV